MSTAFEAIELLDPVAKSETTQVHAEVKHYDPLEKAYYCTNLLDEKQAFFAYEVEEIGPAAGMTRKWRLV